VVMGLIRTPEKKVFTRIGDTEYDITDWIDKHPGGKKMIMLAVNRDSTDLILSYHLRQSHVEQILNKMPKRSIKKEEEEEKNHNNENNNENDVIPRRTAELAVDFQRELQEEVLKYFKESDQDWRGGYKMGLRVCFWILVGALLISSLFLKGTWWIGALVGWWMASVGLAVQHDANHGALFKSRVLNEACCLFDDLIGGSSLIWRHHHVVGHHLFTNHPSLDPDAHAGLPLVKFHPSNPTSWYHAYQHLYFVWLSSLFGFTYQFSDISCYLSGKFGDIPLQPLSLRDRLEFWGGKIAFFSVFLIIPMYLHGWTYIFTWIVLELVGSLYLALTFAISHNTPEIDQLDQNAKDWAELQIRQSSNWGTDSWFANFFTGGLNQQIEHHLFPGVAHRHYPELSKIVKKKCEERNIPYVTYPSFTSNLIALLRHLRQIGNSPSPKLA